MPETRLKNSLSGLGQEIKTTKQDRGDDQRLDTLGNWVDEYLDENTVLENQEHHSFVEDLQEAAEQYEVSHPRLTEVINQVLSALSNMGI